MAVTQRIVDEEPIVIEDDKNLFDRVLEAMAMPGQEVHEFLKSLHSEEKKKASDYYKRINDVKSGKFEPQSIADIRMMDEILTREE